MKKYIIFFYNLQLRWDSKTNRLIYDKSYDLSSNTWWFFENNDIPSSQKGFEKFRKHLIQQDEDNGFITIKIDVNLHTLKQWVKLIVREIKNYYSEKEKRS